MTFRNVTGASYDGPLFILHRNIFAPWVSIVPKAGHGYTLGEAGEFPLPVALPQ